MAQPAPKPAPRPEAKPAYAPPPAVEPMAKARVARNAPAAAADSLSNSERSADLTPDKWLERIEELRKQGKLEEAKASLAEFRKRYPDYRLPDACATESGSDAVTIRRRCRPPSLNRCVLSERL